MYNVNVIVVCTHKSPDTVKNFISSIRKYSKENHKILIVETSDFQISKPIAQEYNCLFTNSDLKYEIGAYNHAMNLYPNENEYFMFQDSLEIVQENWEYHYRELSKNTQMVAMATYALIEDPCPLCGKKEFEELFGFEWPIANASAVMCNCFYLPYAAKENCKLFGIDKLKAENKNDTYAVERVLGAIAHYACGLESVSSLLGDWHWDGNKFTANTGFTQTIQKLILKRQ